MLRIRHAVLVASRRASSSRTILARPMTTLTLQQPRITRCPATRTAPASFHTRASPPLVSHSASAPAGGSSSLASLATAASQQDRWNLLRTLTAGLLTDSNAAGSSAQAASRVEWVQLPNLKSQPSSHHNLQQDTRVDTALNDDDETLRSFLVSKQSLPDYFHDEPILLTPSVRTLWKQLASWDRKQQIKCIEREKTNLVINQSGETAAQPDATDEDNPAPPPIGWSTRGLFLDGPNGVSKSTSLYSLACMARSQNWCTVYISDADAWVSQLQEGGATRFFVQAVYEACAATILPSTASFSQPHSLLQLPLSPELDYTSTLEEQGIHTFGELLTLSLELGDGLEETELSVECIMDQLLHINQLPVLICIDGFDALTQKCLQPPESSASASDSALVAPLSTSPFSFMNYHRTPHAFRGGFLLSGESFALVQQSHPELMERVERKTQDDEEEEGMEQEQEAARPKQHAMQRQHVDPIHVYPLPALPPHLSKAYLLRVLSRDPALKQSFLLQDDLPKAYWSFLHQHVHSGHFSLLGSLPQLPCVASPTSVPASVLRESFLSHTTLANLRAYQAYFGSDASARVELAKFQARHLVQGFYRDFVRNASRGAGGDGTTQQVARDYNLIAINSGESRSMVQWIHQHLGSDSSSSSTRVIADSAPWQQLTAPSQFDRLSKTQLQIVQHAKTELMLQAIAMALLVKQSVPVSANAASLPSSSFPVSSVSHWCSSLDAPLLSLADLEPSSINLHWHLPPALEEAQRANGVAQTPVVTRVVHVSEGHRELTLFLANLDAKLAELLIVEPDRPITQLMHTLYLHYLSDMMKNLEVCLGPTLQVRAHANDGSSYTWSELDDFIEALQSGLFDNSSELPLQGASIVGLRAHAHPASAEGSSAASKDDAHTKEPRLRVVFASISGRAQEADATQTASAAFHPLFAFLEPIVRADLARMLDVDPKELQQIQWS